MTTSPTPPRESVIIADQTRDAPDGTSLSVRVIRPTGNQPVPVLLQRTPYGRPEFPLDDLPMAGLRRGYAIVYEDVRGRGKSDGTFTPWVNEADDGRSAVEWAANQEWSTGNVGMFGSSSPGQLQLFTAAEQPHGLQAIAPMFAPSDLHRADFFQDGAMSALALISWSFGWIAPDTISRLERRGVLGEPVASAARDACEAAVDDLRKTAITRPLTDLPEQVFSDVSLPATLSPEDLVPHWTDWVSRPTYDAFWQSFDPERYYDRIDVPGLHITGWFELCQHGTITNYRGMTRSTRQDQHLIVGPWSHRETSSTIGEIDFGESASAGTYGLTETQLDFFDTYVRGEPAGQFGEDSNYIETFCLGSSGGSWKQHNSWPPQGMRIERFYLQTSDEYDTPHGLLAHEPAPKNEAPSTYHHDPHNPVPTQGGPLCCHPETAAPGMFEQSNHDGRSDVLAFTSRPFSESVEFAGPVSASLVVTTSANGADFAAKLVHITENGTAYNLCDGIQRCRYRRGRDKPLDVSPGEPMQVTIDMWNIHHRVPSGDRIGLYISSSNFPRFDSHPGTTEPWKTTDCDAMSAKQTVFHEAGRQSYLELPHIRTAP